METVYDHDRSIARFAACNGYLPRVGFVNAQLYQDASAFNDIISGNNGGFSAGPGWDPATGLGSPDGVQLLAALSQASAGTASTAKRRRPKVGKESPARARKKR